MNIPLVKDTISNGDIDSLREWLATYPRLTKGPLTVEFESKWAESIGTKHAIFVNSGSSAILAMLYALIVSENIKPGDKVMVPALSWATDVAPVMQLGLEPVLIDCNMDDLSIDIDHLEQTIVTSKSKTLILVSVLGLVPDMDRVMRICELHGVTLLEDVCESLGSKYADKQLGTFGLMSCFSLYFGHHLSSIEGGMICTDSDEMRNILVMIRNHGWDRDLPVDKQTELRSEWDVSDFESLYTFYHPGFNIRATDLQAFIGIKQLDRINEVCEIRNRNYTLYNEFIKNKFWMPKHTQAFVSNFCYPVIHPKRDLIVKALISAGVETRPLIAGSMNTQPFYIKKYGKSIMPNADEVNKFGIYVPNNHEMAEPEVMYVSRIINEIINE